IVDTAEPSVEVDELTEVVEDAAADLRVASNGAGTDRPYTTPAAITATIEALRKKGFARLLIDGRAVAFDEGDVDALPDRSQLQVVVDRVQVSGDEVRQRLTDSIETAYLEGGGAAWAVQIDGPTHVFSERFECRACGIAYEDPQPRLFSFNNPFGACPT